MRSQVLLVKLGLMEIEIRQASREDAPSISVFAYEQMGRSLSVDQIQEIMDSGVGLLAFDNDGLAGLVNGEIVSRQLRIFNILVRRDIRGQGVGSRLLSAFQQQNSACTSLLAFYSPLGPRQHELTPGLSFYERSGFFVASSIEQSCVLVKPVPASSPESIPA